MTEYLQFNERFERLENLLLQTYICKKKVLTFDEAVIYTGRSASNLYKLTGSGAIPHSKPEGKMIYIDREKLEEWMLQNPVRTYESLEMEASTFVTTKRGRKGGWA